jgi:hypothetical protein
VSSVEAFVVDAALALNRGCDPGLPGAAVRAELCGHWEHEGPCRWPHNSALDSACDPAPFRTIFVADPAEAPSIRSRIERALRTSNEWQVMVISERAVSEAESDLAQRLLCGPRAHGPG